MSALLHEAHRMALRGDVLATLDYAESIYRGLQRSTEAQALGIDAATRAGLDKQAEQVYNAVCKLRQMVDEL